MPDLAHTPIRMRNVNKVEVKRARMTTKLDWTERVLSRRGGERIERRKVLEEKEEEGVGIKERAGFST